MKKYLTLSCISLAVLLCACDDNDKNDDLNQNTSALAFTCQNDVQTVSLNDNTTLTMSCKSFGGCDANTKKCTNAPKLENNANTCADAESACSDAVRYLCNNNAWNAVQICDLGCDENKKECKTNVANQCTNDDKKCENNKAYVCKNNAWNEGTTCNLGCDENKKECKIESSASTNHCEDKTAVNYSKDGAKSTTQCETEGFCYINDATKDARCFRDTGWTDYLYSFVDSSYEETKCNQGDPIKSVCEDLYAALDESFKMTAFLQYECTSIDDGYYYVLKEATGCNDFSCSATEGCVDHQTTKECKVDWSTYNGRCSKNELGKTLKNVQPGCDETPQGQQQSFVTYYECRCEDTCCRWTYASDECI